MNKTPSALKWLSEKRGRLAHDMEQLSRLQRELTERLQSATEKLAAVDGTIKVFDSRLDPTAIEPIAWRGTYGGRGALRQALVELLTDASPKWVATSTVALAMRARFNIDFAAPPDWERWQHGSLVRALRRLVQEGTAVISEVGGLIVGSQRSSGSSPSFLGNLP